MPLLLKVYKDISSKKILAIYIFENMRICNKFTENLINYYDLSCNRTSYITYKRFFSVETISRLKYECYKTLDNFFQSI